MDEPTKAWQPQDDLQLIRVFILLTFVFIFSSYLYRTLVTDQRYDTPRADQTSASLAESRRASLAERAARSAQ